MIGPGVAELAQLEHSEQARLELQALLDSAKTQAERNKLGQFATPSRLAREILDSAKTILPPNAKVRFLDPAFGTGSFYSALLRVFPPGQLDAARGFEIDPHYGLKAIDLWSDTPLDLALVDFTQASFPETQEERANLLICNPPYVRHHHVPSEEKSRLQALVKQETGTKLSGLAGLYCYFLLLSHRWLADDGLGIWLIPSEFMDVNYGKQVKQYLLRQVTLLRVHRFSPDEVQFDDALVSSAVLWLRKSPPDEGHKIEFSYGGSLSHPHIRDMIPIRSLKRLAKWSGLPDSHGQDHDSILSQVESGIRVSDLFSIKRGIATGGNRFFILPRQQARKLGLPEEFLTPILPSPRNLPDDEIAAHTDGFPRLDPQLVLLTCDLPEHEVERNYPALWQYLQIGRDHDIHERYLSRHRSPWYAQEKRLPAPLLCTYMGRRGSDDGAPFRFILNHSRAVAPNVYLMLYPKPWLQREIDADPGLLRTLWIALNGLSAETLIGEGRVYGGGLYKMEPGELGNAPLDDRRLDVLIQTMDPTGHQLPLFDYVP